MEPIVYDLAAARQFFLTHSSGNVVCVKPDGTEKECTCYLEAEEFYDDEEE